jgi:hypothetical protein
MGIFNRLLSLGSGQPDYSAPQELRAIFDSYCHQWPDNNERYDCWKPASVLPAPKWAVKNAIKLVYTEWPEPIDWTVFSSFFMEFVDLALHLPQEKYNAIDNFRKLRIARCKEENKFDPLLLVKLPSTLAVGYTIEHSNQEIIQIRDKLQLPSTCEPVDVDDCEIAAIHQILLESTVEFATLIQEWRFYILSVGRDQYIAKSDSTKATTQNESPN